MEKIHKQTNYWVLPDLYGYFVCHNNLSAINMECLDGTLLEWTEKKHSVSEWVNTLKQISLMSMYMREKSNIIHQDLFINNIMFKITNNNERYIKMTEYGKKNDIIMENYTCLQFMFIDFDHICEIGRAHV